MNTFSADQFKKFLRDQDDAAKPIVERLLGLMQARSSTVLAHHHVGQAVIEYENLDPERTGPWMKNLAKALGTSTSRLIKDSRFASEHTVEQAERFDRQGIQWSVVEVLARLKTKQERRQLLDEAPPQGWTVAELKALILQRHGRKNPGGRPPRQPRDKAQLARQIVETSRRWRLYSTRCWGEGERLMAGQAAKDQPKGQAMTELVGLVDEAVNEVGKLIIAAQATLKALRQAQRYFHEKAPKPARSKG